MGAFDELVNANDTVPRPPPPSNPQGHSWFIHPLWLLTVIVAIVAVLRARRRAA